MSTITAPIKLASITTVGGDHPECRNGEIFLCNMNKAGYELLESETKRPGRRAYGQNELPLVQQSGRAQIENPVDLNLFPVFVSQQEYQRSRYSPLKK